MHIKINEDYMRHKSTHNVTIFLKTKLTLILNPAAWTNSNNLENILKMIFCDCLKQEPVSIYIKGYSS